MTSAITRATSWRTYLDFFPACDEVSGDTARDRERAAGGRPLLLDALHRGAELGELLLETFIAAIEVVDARDPRLALGHQSRQHQGRAGSDVGRHHRCALQPLDSLHDRGVLLEPDVG